MYTAKRQSLQRKHNQQAHIESLQVTGAMVLIILCGTLSTL